MTIPNYISLARLVMVPLIVVLIGQSRWAAAFAIFGLAALSDAADGIIARRFDMRSELGSYLDPLADKALLVSIYVALAVMGPLPGWLAIVVVSRDVMIVSAIVISRLMDQPVAIAPLPLSKANTALQLAFAAAALGFLAVLGRIPDEAVYGMGAVAALTIVSASAYLLRWLKYMAG